MSSGTTTAPTKRKRGWSQSEDDTLRQLWPNNPDTTVMAALGRSQSNVHGRAKKLGIKRSPEYLELAKERAAQRIKTDPPPIGVRLNLLTTHGAHTGCAVAGQLQRLRGLGAHGPRIGTRDDHMTLPYDITRCTALQQDGKPIAPCTTCARHVQAQPCGDRTPWTLPPAFWNGERYVCHQHFDAQNAPGRAAPFDPSQAA